MRNMEIPRCYSKGITASCEAITDADAGTMSNENNKAKLKAEIDALRDYDPDRLRRRYRELTGADAATFGARFLQRRCAHRLQELAFGGLSAEELETLTYIADHDPNINKSLREAPRSANDTRGVTYRREYRGKIYEMRSLGGGRYEYEGKVYTSPTAIVRAITGRRHYNGVVWWGLKPRKD